VSTVPTSLIGYRQQLEDAIHRDLATGRARRRRTMVRLVLAGAAALALALGLLSAVSDHAPWAVRPASADSVVRHAAAALGQTPGTILHVDMTGTQRNPDGSTVTWRDESWQLEAAPYSSRRIETADGSTVESGSDSEGDQVYDAARNTIYVDPHPVKQAPPEPHLAHGPRPGTYLLRYGNVAPIVITARQARALRKGIVGIAVRFSKEAGGVATGLALIRRSSLPKHSGSSDDSGPSPDPGSPAFRNQILALLNSGGARVDGHKAIDGHDTIEISSADGHTTYYVDPDSYDPVELDTRGTGGGVALRFRTYESLPAEGNRSLLDLRAQHPDAAVDRNGADYDAAQTRLFPHG